MCVWRSLWSWWKGEDTSNKALSFREKNVFLLSTSLSCGLESLPAVGGFLLPGSTTVVTLCGDPLRALSLGGADAVQHRVSGGGSQTPCKAWGQDCTGLGGRGGEEAPHFLTVLFSS